MFDESFDRREVSEMMMLIYSCFSSSEILSDWRSFAKPCIDASGVLNSWDTLEIKSPLSVSIP